MFQFFTSDDPDIPRELIIDADGQDRFLKYMPKDRGFVNYIENYPYPYVINKLCWEFPCIAPSDWSAQHKHGVNNQVTVDDWKAAIDITVIKKGVMCLVFHPHGWIKPEQIVELIDHTQRKHGKKVKFLTFKEAARRLEENLLRGRGIRPAKSQYMRYQLGEGWDYMGITFPGTKKGEWPDIWAWEDRNGRYARAVGGDSSWKETSKTAKERWVHGPPMSGSGAGYPHYSAADQREAEQLPEEVDPFQIYVSEERWSETTDFPGDTQVIGGDTLKFPPSVARRIREIAKADPRTKRLNRSWETFYVEHFAAFRAVDVNKDGFRDIVYSDAKQFGVFLFDEQQKGWTTVVLDQLRGPKPISGELPPIARRDGTDNGFFVHGDALYWQNENTAKEPHLVVKRTFAEILAAGKKVGWASPTNPGDERQAKANPRSVVGNAHPTAKSPNASLNCIDVREGFRVELVASEPLIRDPVAFDWLPDGRMIVVEMGGYPNGVAANKQGSSVDASSNGRVRILEDTDNDGVYDKATTLLDRLNFPTGVMPWRKGVLISAAPDVIYAEDRDGDGKADKQRVFFTGFKEGNQQHRVNGFEHGLDNWVYVANGDSGGKVKSRKFPGTASIDIRSNDVRILPEERDIGWSTYYGTPPPPDIQRVTGRTQFGRHRDAYGNWFGCNNSNPMWHYVLDEQYIRRNKHFAPRSVQHVVPEVPGNAPVFPISTTPERFNDFHTANRFTSACSTIVYDDDLFGSHFKRNAFICEPVHNLVSRLVLKRNGVTFTGSRAIDERDREFLASTDNWFRPVFVRTGPDGALWIADMYRHVIEHPKWIPEDWQKKLDLRAGHDKGRIYRVVPVTAKPMRELVRFPIKGELEELESPARWVRDTAHHRLTDQATLPKSVLGLLKDWSDLRRRFENAKTPQNRIQILSALDGRHKKWWESGPKLILNALSDKNPDVRRHGIRLSRRYPKDAAIRERLIELAKKPSPAEVLELAYRLGEYDSRDTADALAALVMLNPTDQFVEAAVLSSVNETNLPRLMKVALNPKMPLEFAKAVFETAVRSKDVGLIETGFEVIVAPDVLRNQETKERAVVVAAAIFEEANALKLPASRMPTDKRSQAALEQLTGFVEAASRDRHCKQHSPESVVASIRIMGFIARAKGGKLSAGDANGWKKAFSVSVPQMVQLAVIDEVARYEGSEPIAVFVGNWKNATPVVRARMFSHVLSKGDWISQLLIHLADGDLKSSDFTAAQRAQLLNHKEDWVRESASESFGKLETTDRQALVTKFASSLKPGDAVAGRAVFEKRCATCHRLKGVGKQLGADLASLKDKSRGALLTAILDPNRAVEAKFLSYTAVTEDGKSHSGMIKSETGNAITLIGSDGSERTILRSTIDDFAGSGRSLMPEGLERDMTATDLANVVAFVQVGTGGSTPKRFAGNTPKAVGPAADGSLRLTARDCEIHGPSLVFESHYGNLGFWASKDDHAIWNLSSVKPGRYRVRATIAAPANDSGQQFEVRIAGNKVRAKVPATGSWDNYRTIDVGEILIEDETCSVRVSSVGAVSQYLMDLREIVLLPE